MKESKIIITSMGPGSHSLNVTGMEKEPETSPGSVFSRTGEGAGSDGALGSAINPHSRASKLDASSPARPAHGEKSRCAGHTATHTTGQGSGSG